MNIASDTRLAHVLDDIPGALEYVVGLNPHDFSRLRNPLLRKYMAPRITLGRIAAMVGMPEDRLLHDLAALSGGTAEAVVAATPPTRPQSPAHPPAWLASVDEASLHTVNLLRIDEAAGDPLPPINVALKRLASGGVLVIRHRWEPQPLYDIWTKMGLEWFARPCADDTWEIFVHRPSHVLALGAEITPTIDLQHLPPAERAPRLIAMFEQLSPGETLNVWAQASSWLEEVRALLERERGGDFEWRQTDGPDRLEVRIVKTALPTDHAAAAYLQERDDGHQR